MISESGPSLVP